MMHRSIPFAMVALAALAAAPVIPGCAAAPRPVGESAPRPTCRPVSTYSIVARDPATGEIGVAVQSHWFSVGAIVPWAEAGVGAVATQSLVDPAYGPLGLEHMRAGRAAPAALAALLAGDEGREVRQVAMIDAQGRVAAHTGARCIAEAGHVLDAEGEFSVQANLMAEDTVPAAMAQAYRAAPGDLTDRLLAALAAAEAEGGDIRGRQSAAIVVVAAAPTGRPWADRRFDLRVEDHPQPVAELARLVRLQRAYLHMNAGDLAIEARDFDRASAEYGAAEALAPEIVEMPFWHAVALASAGRVDASLPIFRRVFGREPVWADLVPRLVTAGLLPDDPAVARRILAEARATPE
jgi:uncharacterized Ntn-hydrolase superfamily protein